MKSPRILGSIIFFVGVVFAFALALISIWDVLEATHYFFTGATYEPFDGLHCPILITEGEQGTVAAVFNNPADQSNTFYYRVEISAEGLPRTIEDTVVVPAQGQERVQWLVDKNDIDLRFFIFVNVTVLPNALHPTRDATCGIAVLNVPGLTGGMVFAVALAISIAGIGIGLVIWQRAGFDEAARNMRRALQVLGGVTLLAVLAGLMGWWLIGVVLLSIGVLLIFILVRIVLI